MVIFTATRSSNEVRSSSLFLTNKEEHHNTSTIEITPPLGPNVFGNNAHSAPYHPVRNTNRISLLSSECDYSSSDESFDEQQKLWRYSSGSYSSNDAGVNTASTVSSPTEERKFWQVHESMTVIEPPMSPSDLTAIEMRYKPIKRKSAIKRMSTMQNKIAAPSPALKIHIDLANQVNCILGSTFDDVDQEIEKEWEMTRNKMEESLSALPSISLIMSTYI